VREALGFSTRAARPLLHDFLAFLEVQQNLEALPARVAFEWACGRAAPRAVTSQAARLRVVRGFLSYARASLPEINVPEPGLLAGLRRSHPYLFSPADLTRLLNAARQLSSRSAWATTTYPTLLGLLASCGLRVGEALRLQLHDVALETAPPHLQIHQTKFRKTRLVPLHPTTVEPLHHYADLRQRFGKARGATAFFISDRGSPLSYDIVQNTFQRLVHELALTPTAGQRRPTLHSLRHTFAVQRLLLWAHQGLPVQDWVPHLAVYLGHRRPEDSYWYLTATPELFETAAVAFQQYVETGGEQ
jgi:integrase/recombinase XerD